MKYTLDEPKFLQIKDCFALFGIKYRDDPYDVVDIFSYEDQVLKHRYMFSSNVNYLESYTFGQYLIFQDEYFESLVKQAFHTKALIEYFSFKFNKPHKTVKQLLTISDYMIFNLATLTFVMLNKAKLEETYKRFDNIEMLGPLYVTRDNFTLISFALDDTVYHIPIQIPYYGYKHELVFIDTNKAIKTVATDLDVGILKCLLRKPLTTRRSK